MIGSRRLYWETAAVFLLAFALRLGPLYWSPLPFNPDGIGYAALARATVRAGQFPLSGMATDQVGFTGLLSLVSVLAGQRPLLVAQPTSAAIGAVTVFAGITIAHRLTMVLGWNATRRRQAALLAGVLLAVEGVYLYRSMPTDEQTAGLLLVPALALAVDRWALARSRDEDRSRAWAVLAVVLVVPLALLHNLSALVGAIAVTCVLGIHLVRTPTRRMAAQAGVVGSAVWVFVLGYHLATAAWTPLVIVQSERLARVPGLFVAWVAASVLGAAWFVTTSERRQRGTVVAMVVALFGLLVANTIRTLYPGTTTTPTGVLLALLPLAIPTLLGGTVAHCAATERTSGTTAIGLIAGALALIGVSLTATLSFRYLAMAYRAQLFLHVPVLALAGIGTVRLAAHRNWSAAQLAVVLLVVASVTVSAPVAYSGLEQLTYKGVTTEGEFAATRFAVANFESWATDGHLARVAGYHGSGGARGPTYRWLRLGVAPPSCPVLAQHSWTTTGAQFHPQQPARISEQRFEAWLARNHVVYVVVSDDPVYAVLPRGGRTTECTPADKAGQVR